MASCTEVRSDLKAYIDGELSTGGRSRVDRHLGECAECRRELGAIERLSGELRTLDRATPSQDLRRRILSSLPEEPAPRRSSLFGPLRWPVFAPAAAAAFTVALAGIAVWHYQQQGLPAAVDRLASRTTAEAPTSAQQKLAAVRPEDGMGSASGSLRATQEAHPAPATKPAGPTPAQQSGHSAAELQTSVPPSGAAAAPGRPVKSRRPQPLAIAGLLAPPEGALVQERMHSAPSGGLGGAFGPAGPQGPASSGVSRFAAAKPRAPGQKDADASAMAKAGATEQEPHRALDKAGAEGANAYGMADRAVVSESIASQPVESLDLTVARLDEGARAVKAVAAAEGGYAWHEPGDRKEKGDVDSAITVVVPRDRLTAVKTRLATTGALGTVNLKFQFGVSPLGPNVRLRSTQAGGQSQSAFGRPAGAGGSFGGFGGRAGAPAQSNSGSGALGGGAANEAAQGETRAGKNLSRLSQQAGTQDPYTIPGLRAQERGRSAKSQQGQDARRELNAPDALNSLSQRRDELKRATSMVKLLVRLHEAPAVAAPPAAAASQKAGSKR